MDENTNMLPLMNHALSLFSQDVMTEGVQQDLLTDSLGESDWSLKTGLNLETLCGAIEALIFMSERPMPLTKIKNQIDPDISLSVLHECILRLQQEYESPHHGIRLLEIAEGYQFRTKPSFAKYIHNLYKVQSLVLSPVTLEVLAIMAYKQPVSRQDVDKVRGVDSSHIIRTLMDKKLVSIVGRSDDLGKPVLYGTTQEFLDIFNLRSLNDLPPEHELEVMSHSTSVGEISDIKSLVHQAGKHLLDQNELDELDDLSKNIKSITSETDFTKGLLDEEKKITEGGRKTAFEILEEYIARQDVINQNRLSLESVSPQELIRFVEQGSIQEFVNQTSNLKENLELEEEETENKVESSNLDAEHFDDEAQDSEEWEDVLMANEDGSQIVPEEFIEELIMDEDSFFTEEKMEKAKKLNLDLNFLKKEL